MRQCELIYVSWHGFIPNLKKGGMESPESPEDRKTGKLAVCSIFTLPLVYIIAIGKMP